MFEINQNLQLQSSSQVQKKSLSVILLYLHSDNNFQLNLTFKHVSTNWNSFFLQLAVIFVFVVLLKLDDLIIRIRGM